MVQCWWNSSLENLNMSFLLFAELAAYDLASQTLSFPKELLLFFLIASLQSQMLAEMAPREPFFQVTLST